MNALLNRCAVHVRRGDLIRALGGQRFDLIVCNPPYVPSPTDALPRHGPNTARDGGRDGRLLIDRLCREAGRHLTPGGTVLLVQSSICDVARAIAMLSESGLEAAENRRARGHLGPVMRDRFPMLRQRGLVSGPDGEDLVVVQGRRPSHAAAACFDR